MCAVSLDGKKSRSRAAGVVAKPAVKVSVTVVEAADEGEPTRRPAPYPIEYGEGRWLLPAVVVRSSVAAASRDNCAACFGAQSLALARVESMLSRCFGVL